MTTLDGHLRYDGHFTAEGYPNPDLSNEEMEAVYRHHNARNPTPDNDFISDEGEDLAAAWERRQSRKAAA